MYVMKIFWLWMMLILMGCTSRRQFNAETGDDAVLIHVLQHECMRLLNDVQRTVSEEFKIRGKYLQDTLREYQKDTSALKNGLVRLKYLNLNFKGHKISGDLVIEQTGSLKWKERNAKLIVYFKALQIQNLVSGLQFNLNGTVELTNISGGTWFEVEYLNLSEMRYTVKSNELNWQSGGGAAQNLNINMVVWRNYDSQRIGGLAETENNTKLQFWGKLPSGTDFFQRTLEEPVYRLNCDYHWVLGKTEIQRANYDYSLITHYELTSSCATSYIIEWSRKQQSHAISKNL